jgi:predicted DNA-binding transcriptional regulator YafY
VNSYQETLDLFSSIKIAGKDDALIDFDKRRSIGTDHLNFILETIKGSLQLTFTHKKYQDDSSTNRIVEPYMLKESQGRWYLIAKDLKDNRIKTFALDRISSVDHNKNGTFKKPTDLDLKNYFKNSFGIINLNSPEEVIITVYGNNSSFIKSYPLHHSQKVIEENNESITFSLNLSIAPDFVMELMKYAADLEIIKPIHLRNTIKKNYTKALDRNS